MTLSSIVLFLNFNAIPLLMAGPQIKEVTDGYDDAEAFRVRKALLQDGFLGNCTYGEKAIISEPCWHRGQLWSEPGEIRIPWQPCNLDCFL